MIAAIFATLVVTTYGQHLEITRDLSPEACAVARSMAMTGRTPDEIAAGDRDREEAARKEAARIAAQTPAERAAEKERRQRGFGVISSMSLGVQSVVARRRERVQRCLCSLKRKNGPTPFRAEPVTA